MVQKLMKDILAEALYKKFSPCQVDVIDQSLEHTNHPSMMFKKSEETHFYIVICAPIFSGKTSIEKHRMVHDVVCFAYDQGVHSIKINVIGSIQ